MGRDVMPGVSTTNLPPGILTASVYLAPSAIPGIMFSTENQGYFGTNEDLPNLLYLHSGQWKGCYESGKLRYLSCGNCEVIRMIYPAIRDQYWRTAPAQILSETIAIHEDAFQIEYQARYQLEDVDYQAHYLLQGDAQGRISIEMWGEALSDFWRNRIGLCLLHPIDSCSGKAVTILHPDGTETTATFPTFISPHQPFMGVQGMIWSPTPGVEVQIRFTGDVFETEDQRNWTDGSYKTYGTPLSIPFPVQVQKGARMYQKIQLEYQAIASLPSEDNAPVEITILEKSYPFPLLGTDWNAQMNEDTAPLPLDFLNVLLNLEQTEWRATLASVVQIAQYWGINLGLSVQLPDLTFLDKLLEAVNLAQPFIQYLSIFSQPVPSASFMEAVYQNVKATFPHLPVGYGTDGFFTELNRNRPQTEAFDFVQFSINPQVHAEDTRTLIENLSTQRDIVLTAQSFAQRKPIHVAPITLRWRYNPNPGARIDPRQHSEFAAAWTLLSLKYLAPCAALSYFEWIGEKGIWPTQGSSPLGRYLQQIQQFQPVKIIDTHSSNPLKKDCLLLENAKGERLGFEVDFDREKITCL